MSDLNLIAPLNQLGYGQVGLNVLKTLSRRGVGVACWLPYNPGYSGKGLVRWLLDKGDIHPADEDVVAHAFERTAKYGRLAPCLRIWHPNDMALRVGNEIAYGWPIFELDRFTDVEKHHLEDLDCVLVCSQWAKEVIRQQEVEVNVAVVPLGVDPLVFTPTPLPAEGPTTFLAVGKWEIRKGHDVLRQVFNKAFSPEDDVRLILACHNPFMTEAENAEWAAYYRCSPLGPKIEVLPTRLRTQGELAAVMAKSHCGVFLSRAEGWNLELLEMMSMGRHVIATDCTAHTEYLTAENGFPITMTNTEPAEDGRWFHKQGNWWSFGLAQVEQAVQFMRSIHQSRLDGTLTHNRNGVETARRLSWDNTAAELIRAIRLED